MKLFKYSNFKFSNIFDKSQLADSQRHYRRTGARIPIYTIKNTEENQLEKFDIMKKVLKKETKFDRHPFITQPKMWRRLMEVPNPGEYVRMETKDQRRKQDRAIVRDFCRKVLYLHQKYIP
jgi:hypothetical protein